MNAHSLQPLTMCIRALRVRCEAQGCRRPSSQALRLSQCLGQFQPGWPGCRRAARTCLGLEPSLHRRRWRWAAALWVGALALTVLAVPGSHGAAAPVVPDLRPIKPPVSIPNPWVWLGWGLALALLAAAIAGLRWWRKKHQPQTPSPPPIPPHVRARQRLDRALKYLSDPRLFAFEVSDAVRLYLEERFDLHAPERTTEEFLTELQDSSALTAEQKACLGRFLQSCDLVKFARYEPHEEVLRELHAAACRLVDETRFEPVQPAAVAEVNR
jgi:hypothetical protein